MILYGLKQRATTPEAYRVTGRQLSYLPYGIVVAPNNSGLLSAINETLALANQSGRSEALYKQWFGGIGMAFDDQAKAIYKLNSIPR